MAGVIQWLVGNWQPVVVAILAVDAALIPLFPNAGILVSIKKFLSGAAPKQVGQ